LFISVNPVLYCLIRFAGFTSICMNFEIMFGFQFIFVHFIALRCMGNCRNEMSALYLIQTYCLPSLLYSCETWYLSSCDEKRVEVVWNNAFRKIFHADWYESVKPLLYYCSSLPVSILLPMKKLLFWKKMFAVVLHVLRTAFGFIFLN